MSAAQSERIQAEIALAIEAERAAQEAALGDYVDRYFMDFARWLQDCVAWNPADPSDYPTPYQFDLARDVVAHYRVAGMGPHGLGKTAFMAWFVWWFSTTREAAGRLGRISDWKIITTAGSWKQLTSFLWPEIRKWSRRIRWELTGRGPVELGRELLQLQLQFERGHGQATSVAATDPALIEGAHAPEIAFLYDESKAIEGPTFDATEGAFSTAGPSTGKHAFAVAMSTPGPTEGRFFEIVTDREKPPAERRFPHWHVRTVTVEETIRAGRNDRTWVETMARQWGRENPIFINRVLGQFAKTRPDGVIPYLWVEQAFDRWEDSGTLLRASSTNPLRRERGRLRAIGLDPADSGADDSYMAFLHDDWVRVEQYRPDTAEEEQGEEVGILAVGDQALQRAGQERPVYVVDALGVGAGVASYLRTKKHQRVVPFKSSQKATEARDPTGTFGFDSKRSQAYWYLRCLLDPANPTGRRVAIQPDDRLLGDLTAPSYTVQGDRLVVESKELLRRASRLGRSTDAGDAVVMAFFSELAKPVGVSGGRVRQNEGTSRWAGVATEGLRRDLASLPY